MKAYDLGELFGFMPRTGTGYVIFPHGEGIRIPYASVFPPLEKPWHGYRTDCDCSECRAAQRRSGDR